MGGWVGVWVGVWVGGEGEREQREKRERERGGGGEKASEGGWEGERVAGGKMMQRRLTDGQQGVSVDEQSKCRCRRGCGSVVNPKRRIDRVSRTLPIYNSTPPPPFPQTIPRQSITRNRRALRN